ncbi:MAG: DNA cytosine methyltransferase [Cyanobacteria bacterium]|nr:DNA cytosine methyltransferase [Cyanobacteriota bacterium]
MFKVLSLFAGCGGSSLGYKLSGCQVVASIERDPNAASVYRENFPDTLLYEEDILQMDPVKVLAGCGLKPGELDILDGSPPCQGFSMAGKRRSTDPRNRLFQEYVRFLSAIQPKAFVMENVPGLVAGQMKGIFREMIEALSNEGYEVRARILNAAHYGVPQNRRRVIILGVQKELGFIPEHPMPTSFPVSFREAIENITGHELIQVPTGRALRVAKALKAGESGAHLHQRYGQKPNEFSLMRIHWDKPSPTVLKTLRPGQVGLLHPEEDRFLSIGELKRICSFPDEFILRGSFIERWGRLGNAVPPLLSKAVATCLIKQLEGHENATTRKEAS